jgi:hypothetical protein
MPAGMTGGWAGAGAMLGKAGNPMLWRRAKRQATLKEAHRLRGIMVKSFNAGGPPGKRWKRLSVFTQLISRAQGKGDRRPLMDSGDLRNSHTVTEEQDDVIFVGVHRSAKSKGKRGRDVKGRFTRAGAGSQLVDIATIQEHGTKPIYIRVTPKLRGWWLSMSKKTHGQIKPLRKNTIALIVRVPARPWIGPIWDAEADNSARNIMQDTVKGLGIPQIAGLVR